MSSLISFLEYQPSEQGLEMALYRLLVLLKALGQHGRGEGVLGSQESAFWGKKKRESQNSGRCSMFFQFSKGGREQLPGPLGGWTVGLRGISNSYPQCDRGGKFRRSIKLSSKHSLPKLEIVGRNSVSFWEMGAGG